MHGFQLTSVPLTHICSSRMLFVWILLGISSFWSVLRDLHHDSLHMASDITDAAVTFDNGMAAPVPNPRPSMRRALLFMISVEARVGGPAEPLGTGMYMMIRTYVTP